MPSTRTHFSFATLTTNAPVTAGASIRKGTITSLVKKGKKYQPFSINEQVSFLKRLNKQGKLALFLGAGISKGCGLPDWESLLDCLREKLETESYIMDSNVDVAGIAREYYGKRFNKIIADCLYCNDLNISSSISSIAKSGINMVACFNFDDLFEEVLKTECISNQIVLNGEKFNLTKKGVTVFHPHGYLGRCDTEEGYSNSSIVLSDTDYETLYKDHYCLTNLIQISMLINRTVIFVGMSLSDRNTLRLLKEARKVGVNHWHYAFLKNQVREKQQLKTKELRNIGVDPIWFRDYSDISRIFKELRKTC